MLKMLLFAVLAYKSLVLIFLQTSILSEASSPRFTDQCHSASCTGQNGTSTSTAGTQEFYGNYPFPMYPLPSVSCESLDALEKIGKAEPVVLKNCHLADVTRKWSLEYMEENILSNDLSMYISANRIFHFYREKLHTGKYPWRRPHILKFGNFSTFLNLKKEIEKANNGSRMYLISQLDNDELSTEMQDDVFMFDLAWINALKRRFQWGDHKFNLFAVGMPDVITTVHYDILENLFIQIYGKKRCILFHPDSYKYLYPFPIHHAHDRSSQVNLEKIDFEKFPKSKLLKGWEAILEPGDVLYIPIYWWHHFVSWRRSHTVSYNFWFFPRPTSDYLKVYAPDRTDEIMGNTKSPAAKWMSLGLTRKLERMIAEILQDPSAVGPFLKEMVEDRFTYL